MKNIFKTFLALGLVAASATSCKKYLDVNTNPNDLTAASPNLILPQAIVATGALTYQYQGPAYGMDLGGYIANAGGVGGFGNFWTFVFNSGDNQTLWSNTFDNLQDYQYILNNTSTTGDTKNYNAVARLMKAYDYLKLVDAYGDVPYTQALQGANNVLLPAYDKGSDVYKACITEIDNAIAQMKVAPTASTQVLTPLKIDPTVYSPLSGSGNASLGSEGTTSTGQSMINWIRFANTVKLRAMLRIRKTTALASFYATEKTTMAGLTANDFISADVLTNPGYLQQSGKQNPLWNGLAFTYTGVTATTSFLPSTFVTAFYNGNKLTDDGRGKLIYRDYNHSNQLGFQSTSLVASPIGGEWYTGGGTGTAATGLGVEKGYDQGEPLIMASESYFMQAEANLVGLLPAGMAAATAFDTGIQASFAYLDKDHTDVIAAAYTTATSNPGTQLADYKAANPGSYLVNYAQATTDEQRLEAIITQEYIAVNTLNSDEGWNNFRRTYNAALGTGYPRSNPAGNASTFFGPNFATNASPRTDKLAGRLLYPSTEYSYNTANVPVVNVNSTLVFWDARPTN